MKRLLRWFHTRHHLVAELNNTDRAVRELTHQYYSAKHALDDTQAHHSDLCDIIEDLQEKLAAQHLMLSALGAVETSKANADG